MNNLPSPKESMKYLESGWNKNEKYTYRVFYERNKSKWVWVAYMNKHIHVGLMGKSDNREKAFNEVHSNMDNIDINKTGNSIDWLHKSKFTTTLKVVPYENDYIWEYILKYPSVTVYFNGYIEDKSRYGNRLKYLLNRSNDYKKLERIGSKTIIEFYDHFRVCNSVE